MHPIARQADAVVNEVAAVDRAQGRVGVENNGRPLLACRSVHAARDHAHRGSGFSQLGGEVNAREARSRLQSQLSVMTAHQCGAGDKNRDAMREQRSDWEIEEFFPVICS